MICNVKIVNDEKKIEIKAIVDSGNLLKEPISGYSVIVIEKKSLEGMIENKILDNLNEIVSGKYYDFKEEYISKFRLIPFASLGKQNGMLVGFKPDYLEIEFDGIKKKINKAIIGIYDKEITKNDEYTGIVGLEILEERGKIKSEYNRNIKV